MNLEDVRLAVYSGFAANGRPPDRKTLAVETRSRTVEVVAALRSLADEHHLVLGDDGEVVMAHPFSSVPLGFAVMGSRTLWWGGCAWDSFAVPHLLGASMPDLMLHGECLLVSTRCLACGRAHAWTVGRAAPPEGDQVAHFLIPAAHIWDNVVRACGNQRIFCSPDCVDRWLADTGNDRGYLMDLPTLWRLAENWYEGRLHRGYRRRDPARAAEYFRTIGLSGPFWGVG